MKKLIKLSTVILILIVAFNLYHVHKANKELIYVKVNQCELVDTIKSNNKLFNDLRIWQCFPNGKDGVLYTTTVNIYDSVYVED